MRKPRPVDFILSIGLAVLVIGGCKTPRTLTSPRILLSTPTPTETPIATPEGTQAALAMPPPSVTAMATPMPTSTETPIAPPPLVPADTPTVLPSIPAMAIATATPTPRPRCVVTASALNLREGPSPQYQIIGHLERGNLFEGVRRTADAAWIFGASLKANGWVSAAFLNCTYDLLQLPVVVMLPATYTRSPTDTLTLTAKPTATDTPTASPPTTDWVIVPPTITATPIVPPTITATAPPTAPPPIVQAIAPNTQVNTETLTVVISGLYFRTGCSVWLETVPLTVSDCTPTVAQASVPADILAGYYDLTVINTDSQSHTLTNAYTATNPIPVVAVITPTTCFTNTDQTVIITGANFRNTGAPGRLGANVNNTSLTTVTYVSPITLTAVVPSNSANMAPGVYTLTVTNPGPTGPTSILPDALRILPASTSTLTATCTLTDGPSCSDADGSSIMPYSRGGG